MRPTKLFLILTVLVILFGGIYTYTQSPSNNRNWEVGFEVLPEVEISESQSEIHIKNIRNWNYSKTDIVSQEYIAQTYKLENLEKVWFLVEPFSKWDGIAHTYFVFDFTDQEPISFSIEARREKGETYSAAIGTLNKYELIYMWGTERDFTGRRAYKDNADIYMYPLDIKKETGQKLFLELAKSTEDLRNNPQFYNTLTSNCTNNLAKIANKVNPDSIPFHYAQLVPGYSDEFLYELEFISNNKPLSELKEKYYITEIVKENYLEENFSQKLREELN